MLARRLGGLCFSIHSEAQVADGFLVRKTEIQTKKKPATAVDSIELIPKRSPTHFYGRFEVGKGWREREREQSLANQGSLNGLGRTIDS